MKNKKKNIKIMKGIMDAGIELFFPRRCPVCDDLVKPYNSLICEECREKIRYIGTDFCLKCGKNLKNTEKEYCYDCEHKKHLYDSGMALYDYSTMADSIFRFKYKGRKEYATFYAQEIEKYLGENIRALQPDALIPVPIHKSRKIVRGYNQATVLATELSDVMHIPVYDTVAKRQRKTVAQKELDLNERQKNLKKAFKILPNDVKLNTIVIIDDIYTTGSTIDSLAAEFKMVGVHKIYFVALAIGQGL